MGYGNIIKLCKEWMNQFNNIYNTLIRLLRNTIQNTMIKKLIFSSYWIMPSVLSKNPLQK